MLRLSSAPAPALLALRDSLVASAARKQAHAAELPAALAEGLQRGWPAEHVASVVELIAGVAAPSSMAPLAPPLLQLLPSASSSALPPLSRALAALLPRLDPASLSSCATHLAPLVARMMALLQPNVKSCPPVGATEEESAAHIGLVAALLLPNALPVDDTLTAAVLSALVQLAQSPSPSVLALALRAVVSLVSAANAPPIAPTLLAPLWPLLSPHLRSPHPYLQLLASACVASAGPHSDRSRALLSLLRICSHPLRHLRTAATLFAASAVHGNPSSQTYAAVEAGALLRIDALLATADDEEESAALTLLAELCSLSDEARAAAHALRLTPRLIALGLPITPLSPPSSSSSSAAALRCLRLLACGAPFLRSALVESGVIPRALLAVPRAAPSEFSVLLALLSNVVLDLAPAKRLFIEASGLTLLCPLLQSPTSPPHITRSVLLVLRNLAHGAELAAKLSLLDALPFSHICELIRSLHDEVAEAALALLRNLLHHDGTQVCIKMDPGLLLTISSLPSHAHSPSLLVQALYVLCNIAASNNDLRALLTAHEPALALLSAALASANGPVRVAALWVVQNLTWKQPAHAALCAERGFAPRIALLRADPLLDVRERACSITWM